MGMGVFQQKEPKKCQAPIKLAQPFPAPELRAEILWTSRFFLVFLGNWEGFSASSDSGGRRSGACSHDALPWEKETTLKGPKGNYLDKIDLTRQSRNLFSRVAKASAIYRIEEPRNPENRRKVGQIYENPIFPYFWSIFLLFLPIFKFSIL